MREYSRGQAGREHVFVSDMSTKSASQFEDVVGHWNLCRERDPSPHVTLHGDQIDHSNTAMTATVNIICSQIELY